MKRFMLIVLALSASFGTAALGQEQDITGQWQGVLKANKDLRLIAKITRDDGRLAATMYSIDQGAQGFKASGVKFEGGTLRFTIDPIGGTFEGHLGSDGKMISGTWTQGPTPRPLILSRATPETAWEIPAPPPPPKLMAPDADPSFDVATIKPNPSTGTSMQQLTMNGRNFRIRNGSLGDLIGFAYNVQVKQILNPPDWMNTDRYDIDGVPDKEGAPSPQQLRIMVQKLLAERFGFKSHKEKRPLAAFVLAVGKNGQKITPTQLNGPLPGFGLGPGTGGVTLNVVNATMDEFTGFLQMLVLDRPVVNQTGLNGRYDFHVLFAPDDSQFNGHPPRVPQPEEGKTVDSAPNLFEAMQDQAGLKLSAEKTDVDVIAIDHVEKPSPN